MSESTPPPPGRALDEEIYRQLFAQRTLLGEPLEDWNTNRLCTGLAVPSGHDPETGTVLLINSPGGSVPGMLAIRDCMRTIPCEVATVNLGMAYSARQFLLSAGTRGKRYMMEHAKVLLHQGSGGIGGTAMDIAIQADDLVLTWSRALRNRAQQPTNLKKVRRPYLAEPLQFRLHSLRSHFDIGMLCCGKDGKLDRSAHAFKHIVIVDLVKPDLLVARILDSHERQLMTGQELVNVVLGDADACDRDGPRYELIVELCIFDLPVKGETLANAPPATIMERIT